MHCVPIKHAIKFLNIFGLKKKEGKTRRIRGVGRGGLFYMPGILISIEWRTAGENVAAFARRCVPDVFYSKSYRTYSYYKLLIQDMVIHVCNRICMYFIVLAIHCRYYRCLLVPKMIIYVCGGNGRLISNCNLFYNTMYCGNNLGSRKISAVTIFSFFFFLCKRDMFLGLTDF